MGADDEQSFIAALRQGDEAAFMALVERYHTALVRLALAYVPNRAVAEEVAQETWLGVLRGIKDFEGRSSLKTWIFRILTNRAQTRGERERRSISFSELERNATGEPAVDPANFFPDGHEEAGWWINHPSDWSVLPERRLLARETMAQIEQALAVMPASQRIVISLRDIEGWSPEEVCSLLAISEANQRVLLHRARARVRRTLEAYLDEEQSSL